MSVAPSRAVLRFFLVIVTFGYAEASVSHDGRNLAFGANRSRARYQSLPWSHGG